MKQYQVSSDIQIRFRDTDMLGHVNNVVYVTWMELGRMAFTDKFLPNIDWNKEGFILANVNIDFIDPVLLKDKVKVYMRVSKIGSKSITFECMITRDFGEGEKPAAKGTNVVVAYDYKKNVSVRVQEEWKAAMIGQLE